MVNVESQVRLQLTGDKLGHDNMNHVLAPWLPTPLHLCCKRFPAREH